MVCYLAPHSQSAASAHPSFKAKGITSHTAGPLKDLYIMGAALEPQTAYANYVSAISVFIAATNRQHTLNANAPSIALTGVNRPVFPLTNPWVSFVLRARLSADDMDAFVQKLKEFEPHTETQGKATKITLEKPTLEICQKLERAALDFSMTSQGEILLHDLENYNWLLRVAGEFLATNTYPAFSTPSSETRPQLEGLEPRAYTEMNVWTTPTTKAGLSAMRKLKYDIAIARGDKAEAEKIKADEEWKNFLPDKYNSGKALMDNDAVLVCKASPVPMTFNVGTISEHPGNYAGILFPYFRRMNIPDKVTLRKLVFRHFFRILGSTSEECMERWRSMKGSLDRLAGTDQGMVLTHLFYGIDLSLQTQTRLFAIVEDNEYLGFSLLGERFVIFDGREFQVPMAHDKLDAEVRSLSSHHSALTVIASILSGCEMKEHIEGEMGAEVEVTSSDITTACDLIEEILKRKITEAAETALSEQTSHLRFKAPYYRNTADKIKWVLERLTKKSDEPIDRETPQFIPDDLSLLNDRVFRLLSAFGPDAPSLFNSTGKDVFKLSVLEQTTTGWVVPEKAVQPPKLHIAMKGIKAAHSDWKKVLKDKAIQMDFKERAGRSRCSVVQSKDDVRDIYYGLCAWVTKVGPKPLKRKRGDRGEDDDLAEGEEGPSKPKRSTKSVDTKEDLFKLFD